MADPRIPQYLKGLESAFNEHHIVPLILRRHPTPQVLLRKPPQDLPGSPPKLPLIALSKNWDKELESMLEKMAGGKSYEYYETTPFQLEDSERVTTFILVNGSKVQESEGYIWHDLIKFATVVEDVESLNATNVFGLESTVKYVPASQKE
ncbi:uncharacterized protein BDW70DRAFT_165301 [Aspergillus foveolatus]|uniref:uncharacterized protein n=1 Tax=Aspergillus foveolatus TaxID=210207 RepID=UPI003CCCB5C4